MKYLEYTLNQISHQQLLNWFQFKFATWVDLCLMLVGLLASISSGVALPLLIILFGDLTEQIAFAGKDLGEPSTSNETLNVTGVVEDPC